MQPEEIHHLGHGISYEFYDGGNFHAVRTEGQTTREAVDLWCHQVYELIRANPPGLPLCVLYDLSHPNQTLTPYNRGRTSELARQFPREMRVFSAALLSKSLFNQLVAIFIRTLTVGSNHTVRIFYDEAEAWAWLIEKRAEYLAEEASASMIQGMA